MSDIAEVEVLERDLNPPTPQFLAEGATTTAEREAQLIIAALVQFCVETDADPCARLLQYRDNQAALLKVRERQARDMGIEPNADLSAFARAAIS